MRGGAGQAHAHGAEALLERLRRGDDGARGGAVAGRGIEQSELFAAAGGPPGYAYWAEFLSVAEEEALIGAIGALPLQEARYKEYSAKRRTVSFGFDYDFSYNAIHPAAPVPDFLQPLKARAADWLGVPAAKVRHALIAEYRPGTALGWHRDVPDFDLVCGVSLGAPCRMRFRPYPPRGRSRDVLSIELAPRSAYILRGDARWRWQHSIAPTRALRYSITLRTLMA